MNTYYDRDDVDKDGTGSRHSILYGLKEILDCHPVVYIIFFLCTLFYYRHLINNLKPESVETVIPAIAI